MQNRKEVSVKKNPAGDITLRLAEWKDNSVMARLTPRLACIARRLLNREARCSLSAGDLVNEGAIKLLESKTKVHFESREHYFAVASRAMRQVLVERARRRNTIKRGGQSLEVNFSVAERIGFRDEHELLNFNLALARLARKDPHLSDIVRLHVYEGCSLPEIAGISDCSLSTVRRRWNEAYEWLRNQLKAA